MKVGLLNDLPIAGTLTAGFGSGAELTSGRFLAEGHRRGHAVDALAPEYFSERLVAEYDLLVLKGITRFSREQLAAARARPYVFWPSDWCWNRWRLYFGFQEKDRRSPDLPYWEALATGSRLNVFLSPFHLEGYAWAMPKVRDHPFHLSPPPVDTALFRPDAKGWEPGTGATINGLLDFKGLHELLAYMEQRKDVRWTSIGSIRENVNLPPNVKHIGHLPNLEFARLLGRTETYAELPRTAQPANQSAMVGFLSCKRVITNGLLGFASYDWFRRGNRDKGREELELAMPRLWNRIEPEANA